MNSTTIARQRKYWILLLLLFISSIEMLAQQCSTTLIHAHNDYVNDSPFFNAWKEQVGSIEADVYLWRGSLYVAHAPWEIDRSKTLESLYLKPLSAAIKEHGGYVYADRSKQLNFLIDLKTEGVETMNRLLDKLQKYPLIRSSKSVQVTISGNVPDQALWFSYPDYIHFDGRPNIDYSDDEIKHISMISANLKNYTKWNGTDKLSQTDRQKIKAIITRVHAKGKKIRFWGTPDLPDAWLTLLNLGIDYINTDRVTDLSIFLKKTSCAPAKKNSSL